MGDGRIPLAFVDHVAPAKGEAVLVVGERAVPPDASVERFGRAAAGGHVPGCPCCHPRSPVAAALNRLFLAHAKGSREPVSRVLVLASAEGRRAVLAAIETDVMLRARFRPMP